LTSVLAQPTCASVFRQPKRGSKRAEDEDAVAISRCGRRFAVADGASASAFARLWAHLLVHAYCGGTLDASSLERDLAPMQSRWAELVDRRPLPWYAQEQSRRGAFAALVGLTIDADRRWHALAVGDCCLFQVRAGTLIRAFPVQSAHEFSLRPMLLGSRASANAQLRVAGAIHHVDGEWQPDDIFLLMSDALAAAFLGGNALVLDSPQAFTAWLDLQRARGNVRNDDATLVRLHLGADAAA
jgi:hypothetical protein